MGCAVLVAINVIFIPQYGYMACAWGGFAGYATSMILSYFVGQKLNPIQYDLKSIFTYILLAAVLFVAMIFLPTSWPMWLRLLLNTILIALFVLEIIHKDLPLHSLPVIGKKFNKK